MTPAKPTPARRARSGVKNEQLVAERAVAAMLAKDLFSQWMGMTIVDIRPRTATVRMKVCAEMVNGFGVAHGGVVYSLADSALAFACNTHGKVTVAINNTISYPASAYVGDVLTAVAESDGETRRLGYYRVTIRNQKDELVSAFTGTVYKTKDELATGGTATATDKAK